MKYPQLTELCKNCTGCQKLENPNFKGVYQCKWNKKEKEYKYVQEEIWKK